jgi:hypothetical protein
MMDGVGGSENTDEVAVTGKVNPELLSDAKAHFDSGFLMEIGAKTGLLAALLATVFFS